MIKKILITLFILILFITVCIVSLIVFVDPNNFRGFISDQVKEKTGYELTIEGDLRWHIWPQVSILTDSVKLYDVDAKKPVLTADNMRLDVELFPLISKKLSVKNVFVKSAVINITEESKGKIIKGNVNTSNNNTTNDSLNTNKQKNTSNWKFMLNRFEVADSTIVLQQNDDLINFRNINLILEQDANKKVSVDLKGNIDRNQQDLFYSTNAVVDLDQFPEKATITLNKFDYVYKGMTIPGGELKGNVNGVFDYQQKLSAIKSQNLIFSINDNTFSGSVNIKLNKKPDIELLLNSEKINFTPLLEIQQNTNESITIQQTKPVVSTVAKTNNELSFLNSFNGNAKLNIKELIAKKIALHNISIDISNNDGIATFKNIRFDFAKGHIITTGLANGKTKNTQIKLNTEIKDIDLNTFFNQIETPNDLEGAFNATANLEVSTLVTSKLLENLQGNFAITVTKAILNNINITSIIQNAAAQYTKDVSTSENQKNYTQFHKILANGYLSEGNMQLTTLTANSETLDVITGSGRIGIGKRDLDVNMDIKMLGGWNGKNETIAKLQQLIIPLHIYGQFTNLHYQIDMGKLIKDLFDNKLQQSLDRFRNKLENRDSKDELKQKSKSKQKAINILGELLNK